MHVEGVYKSPTHMHIYVEFFEKLKYFSIKSMQKRAKFLKLPIKR